MTDQADAMRGKIQDVAMRRGFHRRFAGRDDFATRRTRPDDFARYLLDFLDLLQQFLQLGVGLPEDAHTAEVTDVAVKIATGVERHHVAPLQQLVRRRAVAAGPRCYQAVLERQIARLLFLPQPVDDIVLAHSGFASLERGLHGADDARGSLTDKLDLRCRLDRAQPFQHELPIEQLYIAELSTEKLPGVSGQKTWFNTHPPHAVTELFDMLDSSFGRVERSPARRLDDRRRNGSQLALETLHAITDIKRVFGPAPLINDDRKIAADADRIHRVEKEEAVATQQVLDVMPRGGDEDIEVRLPHQPVELRHIERRLRCGFAVRMVHDIQFLSRVTPRFLPSPASTLHSRSLCRRTTRPGAHAARRQGR